MPSFLRRAWVAVLTTTAMVGLMVMVPATASADNLGTEICKAEILDTTGWEWLGYKNQGQCVSALQDHFNGNDQPRAKHGRIPVSFEGHPNPPFPIEWGTFELTHYGFLFEGVVYRFELIGHEYLEGETFLTLDGRVDCSTGWGLASSSFAVSSDHYLGSGWVAEGLGVYLDYDCFAETTSLVSVLAGTGYGHFDGMTFTGIDTAFAGDDEDFHRFEGYVHLDD